MTVSIHFKPFRDDSFERVAALERSDNVASRSATLSLRSSAATPSVAALSRGANPRACHWLPLALGIVAAPVFAAEHRAASAAELSRISPRLQPGDTVVLAAGTWQNQALVFRADGTLQQPVTLRAEIPGKTILTGNSRLLVEGEYLVVDGLHFQGCGPDGETITIKGRRNRLTSTAVVDGNSKFFVRLHGHDHRVERCYFAGKTSEGPTLQIEVSAEEPNRHRLARNHFGPRPPLGRNGGETIRIGYSHQSMNNSRTIVEENLFDRCDGETEIISSKSCENIYRANTFRDCAGMLTLRHGNRCVIDGNFFLGGDKRGSGGIRVIGEDHIVTNNYIERVAHNVFAVRAGEALFKGTAGADWRWQGNFAAGSANVPAGVLRVADLRLTRAADGLLRPGPDSPVRTAPEATWAKTATDIDGQPRGKQSAAGCDEPSAAPVTRRPLAGADTGPAWLPR